ncbi:MAG: hypothetical protein OEX03_11075 [Gammaproteobacteria bacterium]|nr:hypothetical protein [Gammaproteobacteria bacterium]
MQALRKINKLLLAYLLTALFASQWSVAHIHLPQQHDHDGQLHQHTLPPHNHFSIDSSYSTEHLLLAHPDHSVELGNDALLKQPQLFKASTLQPALQPDNFRLVVSADFYCLYQRQTLPVVRIKQTHCHNTRSRGPPVSPV